MRWVRFGANRLPSLLICILLWTLLVLLLRWLGDPASIAPYADSSIRFDPTPRVMLAFGMAAWFLLGAWTAFGLPVSWPLVLSTLTACSLFLGGRTGQLPLCVEPARGMPVS